VIEIRGRGRKVSQMRRGEGKRYRRRGMRDIGDKDSRRRGIEVRGI
jgi:hypothetical protein